MIYFVAYIDLLMKWSHNDWKYVDLKMWRRFEFKVHYSYSHIIWVASRNVNSVYHHRSSLSRVYVLHRTKDDSAEWILTRGRNCAAVITLDGRVRLGETGATLWLADTDQEEHSVKILSTQRARIHSVWEVWSIAKYCTNVQINKMTRKFSSPNMPQEQRRVCVILMYTMNKRIYTQSYPFHHV